MECYNKALFNISRRVFYLSLALGIFVEYTDEALSQKMQTLKECIERFEPEAAISVLNEIMTELE